MRFGSELRTAPSSEGRQFDEFLGNSSFGEAAPSEVKEHHCALRKAEGGNVDIALGRSALRRKDGRVENSLRGITIVVATIVAYRYSLWTLVRNLALDTPLAYLGLIPLISAALAYSALRNNDIGPPIHDRQVDFIIGVPLLASALFINLLLPTQLSTQYWIWRLDMVSLPMFVAGASIILYGLRLTWRARWAVLFLLLAWPYPYTVALLTGLDRFTGMTIRTLAWVVSHIPVATHIASGDGSTFSLTHGAEVFRVSVATQCSGANSLVGFFLIGGALVTAVRGPRHFKLMWMTIGAILTWVLNVIRILIIFAVGQQWGEKVAIDAFHPVLGLILFNLGIALLCWMLPKFGMRLGRSKAREAEPEVGIIVPTQKWFLAVPVVVAVMLTLGLANSSLTRYGLIASDLGLPRLDSFAKSPPQFGDWSKTVKSNSYDWARRFFGDDSTWNRYTLSPNAESTPAELWASAPITADVITGSSLTRLETWGLEACYNFHGYDVEGQRTVDLGGGLKGTTLRFQPFKDSPFYSTIFWHWPVVENGKTRYERVTLMMADNGSTRVRAGAVSSPTFGEAFGGNLKRGKTSAAYGPHELELANYMTAVARKIVSTQTVAPTPSKA